MATARKIEFVKYTGKFPYFCQGYLIVKIDGKEVSFGGYCPEHDGVDYPQFWDCGKWQNEELDWEFDWQDWGKTEPFKDFSDEEREILEKLWEKKAPKGECGGCIDD